jgi:hypothetical protein
MKGYAIERLVRDSYQPLNSIPRSLIIFPFFEAPYLIPKSWRFISSGFDCCVLVCAVGSPGVEPAM